MSPYRSRAASRSPLVTRSLISAANCESLDSGATGAGAPAADDEARRRGTLFMNYGCGEVSFTAAPTIQGFAACSGRGTMLFSHFGVFSPCCRLAANHDEADTRSVRREPQNEHTG